MISIFRLFTLISLFYPVGLNAQSIDTAYASFTNDTLRVSVSGKVMNYDFDAITRIEDAIKTDSVLIDIYFQPCSPFQTFAPYDTSFIVPGSFSQGLHYIRLYGILQKDTVGSCYGFKANDEIIDTALLTFHVPLSTGETHYTGRVKVYPNPTPDRFFFESDAALEKVEIINLAGEVLKEVRLSEEEIDISALPTGIYLIKFELDGQTEMVRIAKQ